MLIPIKNCLFCCPFTDKEIKISNLVTYFSVDGKICIYFSLATCICIIVCVYHYSLRDSRWFEYFTDKFPASVQTFCSTICFEIKKKKLLLLSITLLDIFKIYVLTWLTADWGCLSIYNLAKNMNMLYLFPWIKWYQISVKHCLHHDISLFHSAEIGVWISRIQVLDNRFVLLVFFFALFFPLI